MPRIRIQCPHCRRTLAPGFIRSSAGKLNNAKRVNPGKPKILTPCPHCGEPFGARDLREHKPQCPKNPKNVQSE